MSDSGINRIAIERSETKFIYEIGVKIN